MAYPPKRFVYIIRSLNHPQRRYIGVTSDLAARLNAHNAPARSELLTVSVNAERGGHPPGSKLVPDTPPISTFVPWDSRSNGLPPDLAHSAWCTSFAARIPLSSAP